MEFGVRRVESGVVLERSPIEIYRAKGRLVDWLIGEIKLLKFN